MWQSKPVSYSLRTAGLVLLVALAIYMLADGVAGMLAAFAADGAFAVWMRGAGSVFVILAALLLARPKQALRIARPGVRNVLYAVLLAFFLYLSLSVLSGFLAERVFLAGGTVASGGIIQAIQSQPMFVQILLLCVLAPLASVSLFFGMVQNAMERRFGWWAVAAAGILLGLTGFSPIAALTSSAGGIVMGYAYLKTRSYWCPLALMAAYNVFAVTGLPVTYVTQLPWTLGLFPAAGMSFSNPNYAIYSIGIAAVGALMVYVLLFLLNRANPDRKPERANDAREPGEWFVWGAVVTVLALRLGTGIASMLIG